MQSLIAEEQSGVLLSSLSAVSNHERAEDLTSATMASDEDFWPSADSWQARYRPYNVVNGVLQIPVRGVLLHDFPWQLGSWATGYAYIWKAIERGMADFNVKGIAFMIHSPGGEVAGCFELVDRIYGIRGQKPIRAFAHEYAYSAAYAIASVADDITVSRTGGVGSIGVVTMHIDVSKLMEDIGYKITFIKRGKHKTDGNSYEPLPAHVEARIQARIDALGEVFESSVARNRDMNAETIRAFEALTFMPSEAVSNGLADKIGPLDDAMAAFVADLSKDEGEEQMSTQKDTAVDQAAIDTARAEGRAEGKAEGVAEGKTAGLKEGATAERERISAIIGSEEGQKRPVAAMAAALDTDMPADQVTAFLAKLPEEKSDAPKGKGENGQDFSKAMGQDNPDVGTGGDKAEGEADADDASGVVNFAASMGLPGLRKRTA
ncbi:S49 family peptidase [Mesorhizobium sediminum]|nr:S49 family peptidase [Mesorhizobium sediminum]